VPVRMLRDGVQRLTSHEHGLQWGLTFGEMSIWCAAAYESCRRSVRLDSVTSSVTWRRGSRVAKLAGAL